MNLILLSSNLIFLSLEISYADLKQIIIWHFIRIWLIILTFTLNFGLTFKSNWVCRPIWFVRFGLTINTKLLDSIHYQIKSSKPLSKPSLIFVTMLVCGHMLINSWVKFWIQTKNIVRQKMFMKTVKMHKFAVICRLQEICLQYRQH